MLKLLIGLIYWIINSHNGKALTKAIIDRLIHHFHLINVTG